MMALSHEIVRKDDMATKREAYYVSKNWGEARFLEQPESDAIMDDIEAHFRLNREKLGFIPEEKGGDVAGKLVTSIKIPIAARNYGLIARSLVQGLIPFLLRAKN